MGKNILSLGVPDEINTQEFGKFMAGKKELKKLVKRIALSQGDTRFIAKNKVAISDKKWEEIYILINDSDNRLDYSEQQHVISPKYIAKLLMIFGDHEIVTLILIMTLAGLCSISSDQVNNIDLDAFEKELKVYGIDPVDLRKTITKDHGGKIKYQGILIDNTFDRPKGGGLLAQNGDIKLRIRTRNLNDGTKKQSFIPKRKIESTDTDIFSQLQGYLDSIELDIDLGQLREDQGEMKIALEEDMIIHDRAAIETIFEQGLDMRLVKAKVKLRSSFVLDGAKIEIEKYPGIKDGTGVNKWMPHFAEIEAPNMGLTNDILEKLGIAHLDTSTGSSKDVFKRYNATGGYLDFGGKKPNEIISELLRRDRIIDQAETMMANGYFYTY